jgi:hypothetical protein
MYPSCAINPWLLLEIHEPARLVTWQEKQIAGNSSLGQGFHLDGLICPEV